MELRFVSPLLTELDAIESEVLTCTMWQDVRPSGGVLDLCDWRLCGRLSRLQRKGHLLGQLGEVMLVPGRPRLMADKVLIFGAGPRDAFDEERFVTVVRTMLRTLDELNAHQAVVELPGRQNDRIAAERAADMLLEAAGRSHEACTWILVERAEARRRIMQHMIEERRRVRREP